LIGAEIVFILKRTALFAIIGFIGFIVDYTILHFSKEFIGLYFGRLFSFSGSVFVTWILNRNITFSDRASKKTLLNEFIDYFQIMLIGGTANLLFYTLLIFYVDIFNKNPVIAVALGSLFGMGLNFLFSQRKLYKYKNL
jgi:putative flippase GtrA